LFVFYCGFGKAGWAEGFVQSVNMIFIVSDQVSFVYRAVYYVVKTDRRVGAER
jgi:hypothetical protein